MSVSVVIPTRDRAALLARAVQTAAAQPEAGEVIVVDDGSRVPVEPGGATRVIRHERSQGVARARNAGIAAASGRWIALLDDDDAWAPAHLRTLVRAAERHEAVLAFARHARVTPDARLIEVARTYGADELAVRMLDHNIPVTPSAVLLDADAVRETGGFDEALSVLADWDLFLRIAQLGPAATSYELTVAYTQHARSMVRDVRGILGERARMERKHAELLRRHGRGLGDEIFWQWLVSLSGGRKQRRTAARLYLRHQLPYASDEFIARGLARLARREPVHGSRHAEPRWLAELRAHQRVSSRVENPLK